MNTVAAKLLRLAAIFGFTAVGIGAFGAHGLKPLLTDYQIAIFEKGVQYQFYHTLALALTGILTQYFPDKRPLQWAGWLFAAGILTFSGSLYLLACKDLIPFSVALAGPITPLGGVCFLGGWALIFWSLRGRFASGLTF